MADVYPWQKNAWQKLEQAAAGGRMPHALLISGGRGVGIEHFATCLAERLLRDPSAPDAKHMRRLLDSGNHPDLLRIAPEPDSRVIAVDAIRALIEFISLTSQYGRYKVVLIQPADAMNRHAANTLLKTLEEPPLQSVLMLVTEHPARLPVTVQSRCQRVHLRANPDPETLVWLAKQLPADQDPALVFDLAEEGPLSAGELFGPDGLKIRAAVLEGLQQLRFPRTAALAVADHWQELNAPAAMDWLRRIALDMVRVRTAADARLCNRDIREALQGLVKGLDLKLIMNFHDLVIKNYLLMTGSISLKPAGLLGDLALAWQQMVTEGELS
jgi:DNA polymerase-3 subunit delta'